MIIIVGSPGAGKTVQAQLIEDEANVKWLSTGELLRNSKNAELKKIMESGALVSDAIVEDILVSAIEAVSNGTRILIDGFPRNENQVHWLRGYSVGAGRSIVAIVHLKVPEEEVVKRLQERGRADDNETGIRERYQIYQNEVLPVLDVMTERGTQLIEIDGAQSVEAVHADVMKSLKGIV